MSNLKYQAVAELARDRVADQAQIKTVLSIAAAVALSRSVPLPSSAVEDAYAYWASSACFQLMNGAAAINEQLILNVDLVGEVGRSMWLMRYFNAYPMSVIPLYSEDENHFFSRLAGIGHLMSPELHALCHQNSSTIITLVNKLRECEPGAVAAQDDGPNLV